MASQCCIAQARFSCSDIRSYILLCVCLSLSHSVSSSRARSFCLFLSAPNCSLSIKISCFESLTLFSCCVLTVRFAQKERREKKNEVRTSIHEKSGVLVHSTILCCSLCVVDSFVFECFSTSFSGKFMDIVLPTDFFAKCRRFLLLHS